MIRLTSFSKNYGDVLAVDELSFELAAGDILGMVGQNGAGKTTTLRSLAGIIPPTSGTLEISGFDILRQPAQAKRKVAYIPDEPKLFEYLTVWEHIRFYAAAYRVSDWQTKARELLEKFELAAKQNTTASELSRGMRQKVAICTRFLYDPKAILFDEPHTGLDPQGIRTLKEAIITRAKDGSAVIVSSHLLSLIDDLCTHLIILNKGQCQFYGTIADLREKYPTAADDDSLEEIFFKATATCDDNSE